MVVVFLVLAATAAFAAPDPAVAPLGYFVGKWQCTGTAFAMEDMPEHATAATVNGTWALNGHWVAFSYMETATPKNAHPFAISGYMGYDRQQKAFVLGGVDSIGGYSIEAGPWQGNTLTFTGPWHMNGTTVQSRDTFVKESESQMMHTGAIEQGGKWIKTSQETCKRQK
ncbi:MAG: DUF1579 family protein [Acidobacteria bacterium]|nr:DUF1579 family protein [Acidobacteriota bacterium]MBV9476790.1 DUF1579 family protein [Acidobacteriota bacterium]